MGKLRKSPRSTTQHPDHTVVLDHLTPPYIRLLQMFEPREGYKYLPSSWAVALSGKSTSVTGHRLGWLSSSPNNYLNRHINLNYPTRHHVYSLSDKGHRELIKRELLPRKDKLQHLKSNQYAHDLVACVTLASAEIGSDTYGYDFIPWSELKAHEHVPLATRQAQNPHYIQLPSGHVHADTYPFVIQTPHKTYHFPGIEVQRAQGGDVENEDRSSLKRKYKNWKTFIDTRSYASHYGFDSCLVPFIFTNEAKMRNSIELVRNCSGGKCSWMLFKHVPDLDTLLRFPKPSAFFWDTPWQRAGHTPTLLQDI